MRKVINLTEGYRPAKSHPELSLDENCIEFEKFVFPGGEPHIKLNEFSFDSIALEQVLITTRVNSSQDLLLLGLTVDALRRSCKNELDIEVIVPYFPGARQDRVMVKGEPLTVKFYADIINSFKFSKVYILDPHSDVTAAVVNNCVVQDNFKLTVQALRKIYPKKTAEPIYIVSPDAGSNKKIYSLAEKLTMYNTDFTVLECGKSRDLATGNIKNFKVYDVEDLNGRDCVIVDDICDGGGTFLGLAKELKERNCGDIHLVVTHGIFSKFFALFKGLITSIHTTDSISSEHAMNDVRYDRGAELINYYPHTVNLS